MIYLLEEGKRVPYYISNTDALKEHRITVGRRVIDGAGLTIKARESVK